MLAFEVRLAGAACAAMTVAFAAAAWWVATSGDRAAGPGRWAPFHAGLIDLACTVVLAAALPWATFFVSTWVSRFRSNAAGAALVAGYTAVDAAMLAWLFDWSVRGATAWVFFAGAVLVALVYNVLICDWIAERFGQE